MTPEWDSMIDRDLLIAAGSGDTNAMIGVAEQIMGHLTNGRIDHMAGVGACEMLLRLASSQGDVSHIKSLAGILLLQSAWATPGNEIPVIDDATAEGVALLNHCADRGDEESAEILARAGSFASAETLALARSIPIVERPRS